MKAALIPAVSAALALTAACHGADAPKPVEVKTVRPARGEIVRYATFPATVKANQMAILYAKVPGYLKSIAVDKGDRVNSGQALAEIEVPELVADLARQRAELARAEAEARVAAIESSRLGNAQKKASDLVTPLTVDAAEGRLAVAKAAVTSARAALERTETLLQFGKITAPFAGLVTARFVDPGAFIPAATSGSAAQNAAILTIADFNTVRVQVPVTEIEAALVAIGQPVKVSVEGLGGRAFTGSVSRLAYALDEATKTMLVEADLPNPKLELRPGMYATAKVGVEKHSGALLVPVEALVIEKVTASVFVAEGGKARKTTIKVGFNDGVNAEVLSGLTGNEAVILVGKLALADGAPINATEAK